jgi:hypothetical protein
MIVKAALRDRDGNVHTGKRHIEIYKRVPNLLDSCEEGFVTDCEEFLDRKQAAAHAYRCKQTYYLKESLSSEDLWPK